MVTALVAMLLLATLGLLLCISLALKHLALPINQVGDLLAGLTIDSRPVFGGARGLGDWVFSLF